MKAKLLLGIMFFSYINVVGADEYYGVHGWGVLDNVVNNTPYSMLFYSDPRGLSSQLPDRTTVRIRSLKTGFGAYYGVKKDKEGKWRLYADIQDAKDPAAQFMVSTLSSSSTVILISSKAAGGLFLESDPKTYEVFFVSDKVSDNATWELVEDPKAGDTLDCCFLRNKTTKGFLAASYEVSSSDSGDPIFNLNAQILEAEKTVPYLKITYARTGGVANKVNSAGSVDIAAKLQEKVRGNKLEIFGKDWVTDISGKSKSNCGWTLGRVVEIRYLEGTDPNEKKIHDFFEKGAGSKIKDSDKPLVIIADIEKHPATALKKKLAELTVKTDNLQSLKKREIASTGMDGQRFEANQWSKVSIEALTNFGSDDDRGAPKETIGAKGSRDLQVFAHRRPEFKGSGEERIEGFSAASLITLKSLYSKGVAWIEQSLPIAGQGTIVFGAVAEEGDLQVCFSDSIAPDAVYRIAFGAEANTKAILYKDDLPVQVVTSGQNPNVKIIGGAYEQFWVSMNNGFIMFGKGDPGMNILMAWQDPTPAPGIEKIGFSTFKKGVKIADVQSISDPIVFVAPKVPYVKDSQAIQVGTNESPAWHKFPLSPAGAGTIVFEVKGQDEATLALANEKNEGYLISFGTDGNTTAKILRINGKQDLYKIDTKKLPLAKLEADKPNKFWVTYYKGVFFLGKGNIGQNAFGAFVDVNPPEEVAKIGFAGKASIANLEIWPEVTLGFEKEPSEYVKKRQFSPFSGSLIIINPFEYRIAQKGPYIQFINRLEAGGSGKAYNVGGTPAPDGDYHFRLEISSDGTPKLTYLFDNPSAEQIKLEGSVIVGDAVKDANFSAASALGVASSFQAATGSISGAVMAGVGLAATSAFAIAGVGVAAASGAANAKLNEIQKLSNRYVFTEEVESISKAKGETDAQVQSNAETIKTKMDEIRSKKITKNMDDLDYATKLWKIVISLVTNPYVLDYQGNKARIFTGIKDAYNAVKDLKLNAQTEPIYTRMMSVLISAYNNKYIVSPGDITDEMRRKDQYLWINELAKALFNSPEMSKDGTEINFKSEYLWLPTQLPEPGKGAVTFEAKGFNNAFIGLSENPYQVRNKPTRMYEIIIGMWDNTKTVIHRKSLGDAVVEFNHDIIPALSLDPDEFKPYWINIDKGVITCGVGKLGENQLWKWEDPYPAAPVKYVGLSNWINEVTYRNVRVGTFAELKNVKVAPIPAAKAKKIKGKSKSAVTKPEVKQMSKKTVTASKKQSVSMKNMGKFAVKAK
ncbi:MAG: hypothetical protein V1646_01910 [bacterium]